MMTLRSPVVTPSPLHGVEHLEICFVLLAFLCHGGGPICRVDSCRVRQRSRVVGLVGRHASASLLIRSESGDITTIPITHE